MIKVGYSLGMCAGVTFFVVIVMEQFGFCAVIIIALVNLKAS